jgi:hypothetical protein
MDEAEIDMQFLSAAPYLPYVEEVDYLDARHFGTRGL